MSGNWTDLDPMVPKLSFARTFWERDRSFLSIYFIGINGTNSRVCIMLITWFYIIFRLFIHKKHFEIWTYIKVSSDFWWPLLSEMKRPVRPRQGAATAKQGWNHYCSLNIHFSHYLRSFQCVLRTKKRAFKAFQQIYAKKYFERKPYHHKLL
jgi:hypothetical protein